MQVLVAPDKFKGSLTAREVAQAVSRGLRDVGLESSMLPLADGGDGSVDAALSAGFSSHPAPVRSADGEIHESVFAVRGDTAVVEVANTCGLATLSNGLRPMTSSTYGFGQAILAAVRAGCSRVVLALGGSASTDGGAGMLAALGVEFLDEEGEPISPSGDTLHRIARIDATGLADLRSVELVVASDVTNPLLGPDGAAAVFGPQKGADDHQVRTLDRHLDALVELLPERQQTTRSLATEPGAGAAGGLGFACRWLGGTTVAGADFFLDLLGFDSAVESCDVVITGEGSMDSQTLNGKLPAVVAARSSPRPVHAVVGISLLGSDELQALGVHTVHALAEMTNRDTRTSPGLSLELLELAGTRIGRDLRTTSALP